jgi:hypothetical protein
VQEQRRTQVTRAIPDRHHSQLAPLRDAIKSDTLSALPESGRRPIEGGIFDPASDGLRRRRPLFAVNRRGDLNRRLLELPSRLHRARAGSRERQSYRALQSPPRPRSRVAAGVSAGPAARS